MNISKLILLSTFSCSLLAMDSKVRVAEDLAMDSRVRVAEEELESPGATKRAKVVEEKGIMCDPRSAAQVGKFECFQGIIRQMLCNEVSLYEYIGKYPDAWSAECQKMMAVVGYVFKEYPTLCQELTEYVKGIYNDHSEFIKAASQKNLETPNVRYQLCCHLVQRAYKAGVIDSTTCLVLAESLRDIDLISKALDDGADCTAKVVQEAIESDMETSFVFSLAPVLLERGLLDKCTKAHYWVYYMFEHPTKELPRLWDIIYRSMHKYKLKGSDSDVELLRSQLAKYLTDREIPVEKYMYLQDYVIAD